MTILFLTKKTEENVLRLTEICEHMGIPSITITSDDYHASRMNLTTAIEQGIGATTKIKVFRQSNLLEIDLRDVTGVWTRGLDFGVKPERDHCAENLIHHEWKYHISYLAKAIDKSKWVNWPTAMQNIANKPFQLQVAERFGFKVPNTIVTNSVNEAKNFFRKQKRVIVKMIGEGLPAEMADRGIFTQVVDRPEHLDQIEICPTMLQQAIDKKYDLRVTVIDGFVYTAALKHRERDDSPIDSRE